MKIGAVILWLAPPLVFTTFIRHLHPQERTVDRYIQYFIGLLNGADDSAELFLEQRRASPELKRLLTRRQREMQERRRSSRRGHPSTPFPPIQGLGQTGDLQWNLAPERGDLEDLREQVGDRLLKCLARDGTVPRDVRDTVTRYIHTDPDQRKRGDLEELNLDDPRATARPVVRSCLRKFEGDLISFLKQNADSDGEAYLGRFQRLLRAASSAPSPGIHMHIASYDGDDDDDGDSGWPFWAIFLCILLGLLVLFGLAYGLWFFLKMRLEHRAKEKIAKAAAGGAFR